MLDLACSKNILTISRNGKALCSLPVGSQPASAAVGSASFSMSRGSFKHKDKQSRSTPLFISSAGTNGSSGTLVLTGRGGVPVMEVILQAQGDLLKITPSLFSGKEFNRFSFRISADKDEQVYGCGEQFHSFSLRGDKIRIWVAEHQNAKRITKKLILEKLRGKRHSKVGKSLSYESYYVQPTFVTSSCRFFHGETTGHVMFDFSAPDSFSVELRELAPMYIGYADDFPAVSEMLSGLLGRQEPLPEWANSGFIAGIQGGTEIANRKIKALKDSGAFVAGIWCQDWEGCRVTAFGKQLMWNWEFDKALYPDLPASIEKWHSEGIRFLGYVNPFLAIEGALYAEASQKGYCVKDKDGKDYLVTITTFPAAMVDFTNPAAYAWLKDIIKTNMIGIGMDGWMADFGEYLPTDCVLFSGENAEEIHNRWPAIWAKLNREAVEETGNLGKIFFFTRAGYTESVKYSTLMWNGDQHVDFSIDDGLPSVIPSSLSLGLCGCGITHSDVGGYTTIMHMKRSKELLLRWAEMNAFSPLFRSHEGNRPDDNVQFDCDGEALSHFAKFSRIHAALAPYLRELMAENRERGIPMMRPLFYHYDEPRCYTEGYSYLLGRDLLVAPVIKEGAVSRSVYLPSDTWIHLFTGSEYSGGSHDIAAPIGIPPVFIRKNSPQLSELLSIKEA